MEDPAGESIGRKRRREHARYTGKRRSNRVRILTTVSGIIHVYANVRISRTMRRNDPFGLFSRPYYLDISLGIIVALRAAKLPRFHAFCRQLFPPRTAPRQCNKLATLKYTALLGVQASQASDLKWPRFALLKFAALEASRTRARKKS